MRSHCQRIPQFAFQCSSVPMRLHLVIVSIFGLLASANAVSAASNSKVVNADPLSTIESLKDSASGKRLLRTHKTAEANDGDSPSNEERGWKEIATKAAAAARKAKAKAQFPVWYLAGKKPIQLQEELKLLGVYPLIGHKNWPILKSYTKYYNKRHIEYP
ncbi:hypothetical protein PRIC2_011777 [Phytophthora ramorum]